MAWLAALITAAGAIGSTALAGANQPKTKTQTPVPAAGGGGGPAQDVFQQNVPSRKSAIPSGVTPTPPLVAQLPPWVTPIQPTDQSGPIQAGAKQPVLAPATKPGIGDVLAATPEALAAIAPLLGMMNQQRTRSTHVIGAQGGGAGGQMVQGLNLPQRATISQLLAALPRPRYG